MRDHPIEAFARSFDRVWLDACHSPCTEGSDTHTNCYNRHVKQNRHKKNNLPAASQRLPMRKVAAASTCTVDSPRPGFDRGPHGGFLTQAIQTTVRHLPRA